MNEEEIRKRNDAVRMAVGKALDEYLLEGPENDDRWSGRTVQELAEDFGTYLNIGSELTTTWFNQERNNLRAFRDREGDVWIQVKPNANEYICVTEDTITEDSFSSAACTALNLVPTELGWVEKAFGPIKEI